jgi:hypothetical protein
MSANEHMLRMKTIISVGRLRKEGAGESYLVFEVESRLSGHFWISELLFPISSTRPHYNAPVTVSKVLKVTRGQRR